MKKTFQLIAVLVIAVLAFSSCNKPQEDQYFPKQRLTTISSVEDGMLMDILYDGKYISQIYFDGEVMNVIYDGKQISEINMPSEHSKILFTYQGGKIVRIDCFVNDVEYSYLVFTRNAKDKIKNVTRYVDLDSYDNWKKRCESKLFGLVFDVKTFRNLLEMSTSKGEFSAVMSQDWEYEGNNVVKTIETIDVADESYLYTTTYEYDDCHNPFYGLPYVLGMTSSYSENNVVKTTTVSSWGNMTLSNSVITDVYTYDNNKYPLTRTTIRENGEQDDVVNFTYVK